MKRIGVIIPAYNSGSYLLSTISSILSQEGDYDCKILIVNDFSTDKTTNEILSRYVDNPVVTVINNDRNMGICESRNKGLRLLVSSVDFVMFVDHDDVLAPLAFQKLMRAFDENPDTAAVMGIAYKFGPLVTSEENDFFVQNQRSRKSVSFCGGRFDVSCKATNLLTYPVILASYTVHPPAKALVRSSALVRSGVIFEKRFELIEDWIFWIKLSRFGDIYAIDEETAGYRWHQSNNSQSGNQLVQLKNGWKYLFWYSLQSREYLFSYLKVLGGTRTGNCSYYKSLPEQTIYTQLKFVYNSLILLLLRLVIHIGNLDSGSRSHRASVAGSVN